jgi:serine/threonine-protein kinase
VAFKVLPEEFKANSEIIQNFKAEAVRIAQLNHPYIVTLFEAGEENQAYFIIMEFVEGKNLKELLGGKGRRFPIAAGVQVFSQLAQALDYAHRNKVIHRDIKPANIMWTPHNIIKVMDFGLAKMVDKIREGTSLIGGTPFYMSPEQTLNKDVDHRTDIYAMGVSMYELLTGRVPFAEGDIGYQHLHSAPVLPTKLNPQLSPELERIILKCMAKDKGQRYQSAKDVYEDLVRLADKGGLKT